MLDVVKQFQTKKGAWSKYNHLPFLQEVQNAERKLIKWT